LYFFDIAKYYYFKFHTEMVKIRNESAHDKIKKSLQKGTENSIYSWKNFHILNMNF
jgi:hypothetical protein